MRKNCTLFLILLLVNGILLAQQYPFSYYSVKEGLPASGITSLSQDSTGLTWIGTNDNGLCSYDGYSFQQYEEETESIGYNIHSICTDRDNNVWVASGKGVFVILYRQFTIVPLDSFKSFHVNKIYADGNGNTWILFKDKGLCRISGFNSKGVIYKFFTVTDGLKDNNVNDIGLDYMGRYWIATDKGLDILLPGEDKISHLKLYDLPPDKITTIVPGKKGEMWCGTSRSGALLIRYDSTFTDVKKQYDNFYYNDFEYTISGVTSLTVDKNGAAWIGTDDVGVVYIDPPFIKNLNNENGLGSNQVSGVIDDREGNIWIATQNAGLRVFKGWQFVHYDRNSGFSENQIRCITFGSDNSAWITGYYGLYKVQREMDRLRVLTASLPGELAMAKMNCIGLEGKNIYLGTENNGLIHFGAEDHTVYTMDNGLRSNKINAILIDNLKKVWLATDAGLSKLSDTSIRNVGGPKLAQSVVNTVVQDKAKQIWLGTNEGLVLFDTASPVFFDESSGLKHKRILSLLPGITGDIFIGTLGGGLYYLDKEKYTKGEKESIFLLANSEKLSSNNVYAMTWMNDSLLIVGTDRGFSKVSFKRVDDIRQTSLVDNYNERRGFINPEISMNSIARDADGNIWFGTKSGLTVYSPSKERTSPVKPLIYFTGISVNNKPFYSNSELFRLTGDEIGEKSQRFRYSENYVAFAVTGIFYSEDITYQYFLKGRDKTWSAPASVRVKDYSLNPGHYVFMVKAVSSSGVESEIVKYPFYIKPPFWRTWWFILLMIGFITMFIAWYIKFRERKLQQDKEKLERIVQERTEEILKQKDKIEEQKKSLTDSIMYAERIQSAVLTKPEIVKQYLKDYFILYMPRDIVSGDFYWFGEVDDTLVTVVADCTGHGVPGAFMSMLGITVLNEIVMERKITRPDEILNLTRDYVIQSLKQQAKESSQKDGMDMGVCTFEKKKKEIQFAGAYHPLWIVREGELLSYKADRMPVAIHVVMDKFSLQTFEYKKGDKLYIASDGFQDQFGGDDKEKYKSKRLKETLLATSHLSMVEQKEELLKEFHSWKGGNSQVDDVSLVGLEL
ncbi:MAG: SpoIIE family protein phosphatase [Bacteroidales bacterium]|nr:SpoIIE family protein phosphatase [Bacteroidales bacterium]